MLLAVALIELDLLPLQLVDPLTECLHGDALHDRGNRVELRRRRSGNPLNLFVECFPLNPFGLGASILIVQLIQAGDYRVLAIFQGERVVMFAIVGHRALAVLDLGLLLGDLIAQKHQPLLCRLGPQLKVLLHVLFDVRIGGQRRECRV